jgi:hypothetical protein
MDPDFRVRFQTQKWQPWNGERKQPMVKPWDWLATDAQAPDGRQKINAIYRPRLP